VLFPGAAAGLFLTAAWTGGIKNPTWTGNSEFIRLSPKADVRLLKTFSVLLPGSSRQVIFKGIRENI